MKTALFKITVLLSYGMIQWFLVCSQTCATIPTINFRTFSSSQKENPIAISIYSPFLPNFSILSHHNSTFGLVRSAYSGHFVQTESQKGMFRDWLLSLACFETVPCASTSLTSTAE